MRFHVVRIDEDSLRLLEEARSAVESVERLLTGFESSVRSGRLEEALTRLSTILERLLLHGVGAVEDALERARLLASYAHALRVRLESRFGGGQPYLSREYNDFVRHMAFIKRVVEDLHAMVSTALGASGSRVSAPGRSRARPGV